MNYRLQYFRIKALIKGLFHWKCVKCGYRKGPTKSKFCYSCQMDNIAKALFE